jgi:hypothetical protein
MNAALYSDMKSESSQSQTSTTVHPISGFVRNSRVVDAWNGLYESAWALIYEQNFKRAKINLRISLNFCENETNISTLRLKDNFSFFGSSLGTTL